MKYAEHYGLEMSIAPTTSHGRYEITAKVGNETINAETTNAEVYDYFDTDYYDERQLDYARDEAYNAIMEKAEDIALTKFYDCVFNWGADPAICETGDDALQLMMLEGDGCECLEPEDEWFDTYLERLGIDGAQRIYLLGATNTERCAVALSEDIND